jgi:hypothetical protein
LILLIPPTRSIPSILLISSILLSLVILPIRRRPWLGGGAADRRSHVVRALRVFETKIVGTGRSARGEWDAQPDRARSGLDNR